eukprot:TRINITY_DN33333_c0_g1_i1.p2 TRINITY_DN33333_c0_g1~~TRINITY_DN33333_c0_g1_i1.p2  ORF type:complete len:104 (-),score=16.17 TRINITY_DN33333_c0_g1_i1:11-322(-)
MLRSLVGSEMCIRDRCIAVLLGTVLQVPVGDLPTSLLHGILSMITAIAAVEWVCTDHELTPVLWSLCTTTIYIACLLYTSDAADEEDSVNLGGWRFVKQKIEV